MRKKLSTGRITLLSILGLFLAAVLAWALEDLVRNMLAVPLIHLYYFLALLVNSTPQAVFWGILLLVLLVVAGKSVQEAGQPELPDFGDPLRIPKRERIGFWAIHINMALQGDYYSRARLAEFLGGVAMDLFAQEERVSVNEVSLRLERGELDLPPEVENYLKARFTNTYQPRPGFWVKARDKLARFWNSFFGKSSLASKSIHSERYSERELERIIQYLEDRLEGTYGS